MEKALLSAVNVTKKYNRNVILNNINLSIEKGECIALVGENGCGKSTLIRVLASMTNPTSGKVVCSPKLRLGLIPDRYEKINLTIRKFMRHMLQLERVKYSVLDHYYNEFSLENMLDTPMKYLSKGSLQKIAVIQALISDRDIMLMDEPLSGQDADSKAEFAAELRRRKEKGMSIIMACHEPYLVEELADNIIQIKNGEISNGTEYMFNRSKSSCQFLIACDNDTPDFMKMIGNEVISKSLSVSRFGSLYKLKAERTYAKELFRIFLTQNVHIVKYEEIEEPC